MIVATYLRPSDPPRTLNIWPDINFGYIYRLCTRSGRMNEFSLTLRYRSPVAPEEKAVRTLVCSKNIKHIFATHQNKGICGELKA